MSRILNPHGAIIVDGKVVGDTLQCPHCGGHFQTIKGSGKRRFFCMKCMAVCCGHPDCDKCVHVEKKFESVEKGGSWLTP